MPRDVILPPPTHGIDIVNPSGLIGPRRCSKAENVVFTVHTVRRRLAKLAAYIWPAAASVAITMMHRFYNLATTGTVDKMVVASTGTTNAIYRHRTSWSDDAKTLISSAWTLLLTPRVSENTLYFKDGAGYSSSTIGFSDGSLKHALAAKSWLYMYPDFSSSDDASKVLNVPLRTQGGIPAASDSEVFLHGLVPPNPLDTADYSGQRNVPSTSEWSFQTVLAGTGAIVPSRIRIDSAGKIHLLYQEVAPVMGYNFLTSGVWSPQETPGAGALGGPPSYFDMALNSSNLPRVVWYDTTPGFNDLRYTERNSGGTWAAAAIIDNTSADVGSYCSMAIDKSDNIHVAYYDTTNTQLKYAISVDDGATWTLEVVDTTGDVGRFASIALDSKGIPHIAYYDATNLRLLYTHRTTGVWATPEVVHDDGANTVGQYASLAIDSNDIPAIAYVHVTNADVLYAKRDGGTWSTLETVSSTAVVPTDTKLLFDANNLAHVVWSENNTAAHIGIRVNGTWTNNTGAISTAHSIPDLAIGSDGRLHISVATDAATFSMQYSFVDNFHYFYKLTAEYDDGILGESGPSAAVEIVLPKSISSSQPHLIDMTPADARYDMTKDVTRIHIYRTVAAASSDSSYFRVGTVLCSSGTPSSDFGDNVPDVDLVTETILDEDRYLPPKYKTAAWWKDRLVIGNLKCRDTTDSTQLDYEATGIHKNRIRSSRAGFPDIFPAGFFQDLEPDTDSGSIVRLIVNPAVDALFVFMDDNVVALTDPRGDLLTALSYVPRTVLGADGTPAPDSVVYHDGRLFYFTKHGIRVIDGLSSRLITTESIAPLWNQQDPGHTAYANRINMSQIGLVQGERSIGPTWERILYSYPRATSTFNDFVMVLHYDVWKARGFVGDPPFSFASNIRASKFMRWDGEGDRGELFAGEADTAKRAWIYRLDIGDQEQDGNTTSTPTDTVVPQSLLYPGLTDAGSPHLLKKWKTVGVNIKAVSSPAASNTMTLKFDVDEGKGSYPLTLDTYNPAVDGSAHPRRDGRKIPRTAVGVYGGALLEISDVQGIGFPAPWELYGIFYEVDDLTARHRGERNT